MTLANVEYAVSPLLAVRRDPAAPEIVKTDDSANLRICSKSQTEPECLSEPVIPPIPPVAVPQAPWRRRTAQTQTRF